MVDKTEKSKDLVIFDLDGTLIRIREKPKHIRHMSQNPGYISLRDQFRKKLMEFGIPFDEYEGLNRVALIWNKTREILNREGHESIRVSDIMDALDQLLLAHEEEEHEDCILLSGVGETLKKMRDKGYIIGIVTTTSKRELLKIFRRFDFGRYIDLYVTRDDVDYLKPNPEPLKKILKEFGKRKFYYVGDADHDAEAVRSLGYGFEGNFTLLNTRGYDEETIRSIKPDAVIYTPAEIIEILARFQKQ